MGLLDLCPIILFPELQATSGDWKDIYLTLSAPPGRILAPLSRSRVKVLTTGFSEIDQKAKPAFLQFGQQVAQRIVPPQVGTDDRV
jgi:hypothetical protein